MVPHFPPPTFPSRPRARRHHVTSAEPLERRVLLSAAAASLAADTGVFNGHAYQVVRDTRTNWTDAQAAARAAGGHLVTINSPAEQAFLENLLAGAGAPTGAYKMGGVMTSNSPVTFGWATGEPFSYTHWDPTGGEPNSGDTEPVMAMLWTRTPGEQMYFRRGFWNNEFERGYRPGESVYADVNQGGYIIETDAAADTGVFNGHTYRVVRDTQTGWTAAEAAAEAAGGHLATVNSDGEQAFLESLLAGSDAPTGAYKIGGHVTSTSPLRFGWITGEPFSYSHWYSGEPNSGFFEPGHEPVMAMLWTKAAAEPTFSRRGFWNDELEAGYRPGVSIFDDVNQGGYVIETDSADQVYQAEKAAITGAIVATTHPDFGGTGYVDYQHAAGDAVEFTVNVPTAGQYALDFRYANGGVADRAMGLSVNGTAVAGGVRFARTASWRTWNTVSATAPLAAGNNTVRLLATGQSGPNLDALSLRRIEPPAAVTYQAESAALLGPIARSTHGGFTGTGYADYINLRGDAVEFTIDVPSDGTYALDFRYANGTTSDRPLELRVDGQVVAPRMGFAPTVTWNRWATATQSVPLTAGSHVVRLGTLGQSGPNLDALTVRPLQ